MQFPHHTVLVVQIRCLTVQYFIISTKSFLKVLAADLAMK